MDLRFREGSPTEIQEAVRRGQLDLALAYGLQADPDLEAIHLADITLHVMLQQATGWPHLAIHLGDIIGEPAILLNIPPTIERLTSITADLGLHLDVRWSSSNMETIRSMVARGLGFALVNSVRATGATFDGREVVYLPVADPVRANALVGLVAAGHRPNRRVREALAAARGS